MSLTKAVITNVAPIPDTKIPLSGSFPTAAPANYRTAAMTIVEKDGVVSLTHNATNTGLQFTLYMWCENAGWWIPVPAQTCAQYAMTSWSVFPGTRIYISAGAALTGTNPTVWVGGVTLTGVQSSQQAGV